MNGKDREDTDNLGSLRKIIWSKCTKKITVFKIKMKKRGIFVWRDFS